MGITRSQVSAKLKISSETIRYYESLGLISPKRDINSGYRIYKKNDIERLDIILRLKKFGYKLKDIKLFFDLINDGVENKERLNLYLTNQIDLIKNKIDEYNSIMNLLIRFRDKKDVESCELFSKLINRP